MASPDSGKHGCGTSLFGLIMIAAWVACMYYGLLWQTNDKAKSGYDTVVDNAASAVPMLIDAGRLLLIQPDLRLTVLDMATGRVVFRGRDELDSAVLSPTGPAPDLELFGNLLLVKKDGLLLTAVDKRDGRVAIEARVKRQYEIRGNNLYFYDKRGDLVMVERNAPDTLPFHRSRVDALTLAVIREKGESLPRKPEGLANPGVALMRKRQFVRSAVFELPGNALVRVGDLHERMRLDAAKGEKTAWLHRIMEFGDAENRWEGRINCLDDIAMEDAKARRFGPRTRFSLEYT